jgi:hypothetical protein
MGAEFGATRYGDPDDVRRPELLRQVTGISPEAAGMHVLLRRAGYRSVQRLVLLEVNGGIRAALWPGELKPHAKYLYSDHRAERFVSVALQGAWSVRPNPHIAFFQAPPHQRLYLDPIVDLRQYVELWEGPGWERIRGYSQEELTASLWPWLKERGCATAADDPVFGEFLRLLGGRRLAHLRPGLRAEHVWLRNEVAALSASQLAAEVRAEVNRVLQAIGEPRLPAT